MEVAAREENDKGTFDSLESVYPYDTPLFVKYNSTCMDAPAGRSYKVHPGTPSEVDYLM